MTVRILFAAAFLLSATNLWAQNIAGKWRGEFIIQDTVRVPFNFEISKRHEVILINGEERFETGKLKVTGDSIFIPLDQFDNELAFRLKSNRLTGVLRKQDGSFLANVSAERGLVYRFKNTENRSPKDIGGKYAVVFNAGTANAEVSVGIFKQKGNKLSATFLKPSGDTRYLDGIVIGSRFYLSTFIGSTPGYYQGVITDSGEMLAEQIGTKSRHTISGRFDANAELPKENIRVENGAPFNFELRDIEGKTVTLNDEKYKNKVVIVSITGTWCPNCIDEARYLAPWYKKNKDRGVEIVLVHFERQDDTAHYRKVMKRFRDRFGIEYDQVFGGLVNKAAVLKALPQLKDFSAYPTTIFLDKEKNIANIHTGFSGPATGKYYDELIKEFNDQIDRLISSH